MLWKWGVWNGCVLDWLNPQPKPKADPGMCWDHGWAAGEVGSGTTHTHWHQELAFSRFFCTSTEWPEDEDEDEWWFPDKLLGRGHLAQSPPKVSLVIMQGQPDLPGVSRGTFPTFSMCSDLGYTFEPTAMLVQNLSVVWVFFFPSQQNHSCWMLKSRQPHCPHWACSG